jgi:mono/diheme cytochrome c family protein
MNGEGKARTSLGRSVPGLLNPDFLRIAQPDTLREVAQKGRPDRDMPTWRDALARPSLEAILGFIEEHRAQPKDVERILALQGSTDRGRQVFARNCAVCHGTAGEGIIGPRLRSGAFLGIASDRFLLETLNHGRPHTPMPAWADLSGEDQAGLLALFRAWRQENGGSRATAKVEPGQPFQGEPVYAANCARCHGERGQGGPAAAIHNPVLLASASPEYLAGSLPRCRQWAQEAPKARPLAPPELPAQKLGDLVAFLQSWRSDPRPVPPSKYRPLAGDPGKGASLFKGQCAGCHGERGVKGLAPAIGSPRFLETVSDGYLAATIALGRANTVMTARGTNAPGNPRPLDPQEILDVVAYLRSLARKEESR